MRPRLLMAFLVIVLVPLAILGWLGARVARSEREIVRHRVTELLVSRLRDVDSDISEVLARKERVLLSGGDLGGLSPDNLRDRARRQPAVRQFFVLDDRGMPVYPSFAAPMTEAEDNFIERTRLIWENREIPAGSAEIQATITPTPDVASKLGKGTAANKGVDAHGTKGGPVSRGKGGDAIVGKGMPMPLSLEKGWHSWYWGNGINLIFWWRDGTGRIVGAELNQMNLMADIIAALPNTDEFRATLPDGRIALRDAKGEMIYQWGAYVPGEGERPRTSLALGPPLGAWGLDYYAPADFAGVGLGKGLMLNLVAGLATACIAVAGLAVYFYRESSRDMREAAQRVSFVNQVSHELKTPLTSIRMYAELLEDDLCEADAKSRRRLDVIVSESQRLSRLIGNVLTFSRKQRSMLKLRPVPGVVDEVLNSLLCGFEAPLKAKGIDVSFAGGAGTRAFFDSDALEQVVGNLLSNVEKYAVGGRLVTVVSAQTDDIVTVIVHDDGPGIPVAERKRVFEPFHRVSDKLTDGVAGTGIGLSIARDLARLHGGDLVLEDSEEGARFRLTIRAPREPMRQT